MRSVVLAFYLLCSVGCSEPTTVKQSEVLQLHLDPDVKVNLSPADAPVEEILYWTVELTKGWQILQAEVTGLSMSMGTIPLVFKAVTGHPELYSTEMVLGACSQPRMKWQLQLTLGHSSGAEKLLLLPFYSSWPS